MIYRRCIGISWKLRRLGIHFLVPFHKEKPLGFARSPRFAEDVFSHFPQVGHPLLGETIERTHRFWGVLMQIQVTSPYFIA